MTLSTTALVTLNQAKSYLKVDAAASLHIAAEYVGTGTGTEDDFALDHTPVEGTLKLYVNNTLKVETTDFTLTVAAIKFVTAAIPTNGQIVTASYDYAASANTFDSYDDDIIERLIEGATKKAQDYCGRQFVNDTITENHQGDGAIMRLYKRPVNSITAVSYKTTETFTGDAVTADFVLDYTPYSGSLKVYVDGTLQTSATHYNLTTATVTFTAGNIPSSGAVIICIYNITMDISTDYTEQLSIGRLKGSFDKNTEYQVIYSAGYGADRDTVQPLIPDAVTAVLIILANDYNNRMGVSSENVSGIGSVSYDTGIPETARAKLQSLRV
jgi:hypothetical protein